MKEFLWQAFVTLLVIIDPIAVLPVFMGLTRRDTREHQKLTARKACIIALILLSFFAIAGDKLLHVMGISPGAFRIAGGGLLLLAAIDMVMAHSAHSRGPTGEEAKEAGRRDDISVFPLAIPLIAGPGALTSVVVLMQQADSLGWMARSGVLLLMVIVVVITYIAMCFSSRLMKYLGVTGANVLTRVFGVILAGLAVQNIIHGIVSVWQKVP